MDMTQLKSEKVHRFIWNKDDNLNASPQCPQEMFLLWFKNERLQTKQNKR